MDLSFIKDLGNVQILGIIAIFYIVTKTPWIVKIIQDLIGKKFKTKKVRELSIKEQIRIFEIEEYETIAEQNSLISRLADRIKIMLVEHYRNKLDFNDKDSYRQIRAYENIIIVSLKPAKERLREWVKENHLLQRTETEFKFYAEETAAEIYALTSGEITEHYHDEDFDIKRVDSIKEIRAKIGDKMIDVVISTFYAMREISAKKRKEVLSIRA